MIRILWILFLIGTLGAIWLLKRRHRKRRTPRHQIGDIHNRVFGPTFRELSDFGLHIGHWQWSRSTRQDHPISETRNWQGLTPAMCADRIVKILRKDKLDWPRLINGAHTSRPIQIVTHLRHFASISKRKHTSKLQRLKHTRQLFTATYSAKNIQEMKQAGFKNVFWACRSQDACCDICASLNGRKMPIDMFMEMCLIHPCCNGMPGWIHHVNKEIER